MTHACVCRVRSDFRLPRYRCVSTLLSTAGRRIPAAISGGTRMQKAHLYEAILLVNRGIDEAVRGLEQLKRTKDSGLDPACFDEKVTLFEIHRASINGYFCNNVERSEHRDLARFEKKQREYEKSALDEVQVYQDLRAVE